MMEKIVSLCKRRGFIFQGSEIYGGLSGIWDYGPLGVELKKNIKELWWKSVVYQRTDIYGLDSAILMHPRVWKASGHLENFVDEWVDCKGCKKRFKVEEVERERCPECGGELTCSRHFNLMFKTSSPGAVEDEQNLFLRPETAQGIFVNFANILDTFHPKLPFGIAQIGKAFRNEITTRNFTFRTREFEQMEIEYFTKPEDAERWYEYWIKERLDWYIRWGIRKENLRVRTHQKEELAHYAQACADIEYKFPFGWKELEGIANRQDFDLREHSKESEEDLRYFDEKRNISLFPYIIEPSAGVERSLLAFLVDAYHEEEIKGRKRVVLRLHKALAPVKVAILPLLRNRKEVVEMAKRVRDLLLGDFVLRYDDTASIGKLYRRQDEIGTPYCITVDVQSLEDRKVTVRERDTMLQERVSIDQVKEYLQERLKC